MVNDVAVLISSKDTGPQSGKSLFAKYVIDYIYEFNIETGREKQIAPYLIEMAYPLKAICKQLFSATDDHLYGVLKYAPTDFSIDGVGENVNFRQIMRHIGQYFREVFGEDIWVQSSYKRFEQYIRESPMFSHVAVVPDWRHDNEYKYFEDRGIDCILIDVRRKNTSKDMNHISEKSITINDELYTSIIYNDKDKYALKNQAEQFVKNTLNLVL